MKKNAFTLVELLAVIVILAIILAIAIPSISTVVNIVTRNSFDSTAKLVLKAVDLKRMEDSSFDPTSINENTIKTTLNIDNSNYEKLTVKKLNGELYVTIIGKNKWAGLTVSGTKVASKTYNTVLNYVRGANAPVLATDMKPIKWDGSTWIETTSSDTSWYNYDTTNKIWANARTADGSMWVWIPRYIYKISTGWHTSTVGTIDIQFTKGVDDNWNSSVIGNINLNDGADASNGTWTNHPGFTFGDTELTGIWVAKFEASSSNPAATYGGGNVTTLYVKSIPNVAAWRAITINNIFTVTRNMETDNTYGWGTTGTGIDTHMMKNTEWGAVAYLTQSVYGKNSQVWINNSKPHTTGCAGSSVSAASYDGCENTYNTTNGLQASTTGNIYGVYDISGGSLEYVASYINNGNTNLTTYGNDIINTSNKYKEQYSVASTDDAAKNYELMINFKGDAVYETSAGGADLWAGAWNKDASYMLKTTEPWFRRGGCYSDNTAAGAYYLTRGNGSTNTGISFRPVLLVGEGL